MGFEMRPMASSRGTSRKMTVPNDSSMGRFAGLQTMPPPHEMIERPSYLSPASVSVSMRRKPSSPSSAKMRGDLAMLNGLDAVVDVDERQARDRGQPTRDARLARTHESHEQDVVVAGFARHKAMRSRYASQAAMTSSTTSAPNFSR